jgi:NADH:ubiquinone reductase (non-electrogenic)
MFSKQLIAYTESTFKESKIEIMTKTMVKEVTFFILAFHFLVLNYFALQVKEKSVVLQLPDKSIVEVPCGLVIWAAGNKGRKLTQDLMAKIPNVQTNKRGIIVDGMHLL